MEFSMKLKRLTMRNFMPYKGDAILDFPQDPSQNTLIVFGDNMRGKTSLLNAIRWTFYGNAIGRHLRPIALNLMPNRESASIGDWTMETRIEFEVDGNQYDLRRVSEKKPLVAIPSRPDDFIVSTYMRKNGSAIPGDQINNEINQFAPEQVSRFFLFDGELLQEYEELLIEDSDQGRKIKDSIEQALGVPALINGRDDSTVILKRAQKIQAQEAAQTKGLEGVSDSFLQWTVRHEKLDNDVKNLQKSFGVIHDERLALDDEIEKVDAIYRQKDELSFNKLKAAEILSKIDQKSNARLQLVAQLWTDFISPRLLAKRDALSEEQARAMELIGQRSHIQAHIDQTIQYLNNSTCPTCHQPTMVDGKVAKEAELKVLQSNLADLNRNDQNFANIAIELQALNKLIGQGVGGRLIDADKELSQLELELAKVDSKIYELNEKTKSYDTDAILKQRTYRDRLIRDETKISVDIEDLKTKIIGADKELRILSQRIAISDSSQKAAHGAKLAELCEKIQTTFSLSIDRLRDALRLEVQVKASEAFQMMSTQKSYQGLQINKNYGLTILDQNGEEVSLRSAGAEQIVALSLIDGLSKSARSAGPVIMDTPFGRLDTKHRKNILAYLPKTASQLVLFVHDGEIRNEEDLDPLAHHIGGRYVIREVSPSHSILERC